MFCTQCGTKNNPDAKFCTKCGSAISPVQTDPQHWQVENEPQPDTNLPTPSTTDKNRIKSTRSKRNRTKLVIGVSSLCLVLVIGVAVLVAPNLNTSPTLSDSKLREISLSETDISNGGMSFANGGENVEDFKDYFTVNASGDSPSCDSGDAVIATISRLENVSFYSFALSTDVLTTFNQWIFDAGTDQKALDLAQQLSSKYRSFDCQSEMGFSGTVDTDLSQLVQGAHPGHVWSWVKRFGLSTWANASAVEVRGRYIMLSDVSGHNGYSATDVGLTMGNIVTKFVQ